MYEIVVATAINIALLTQGEVFNLAGHDRGLAARHHFELSKLDEQQQEVKVLFPEGFRGLSSSFFQGMFSQSVRYFGSVDGFLQHYIFVAPAHVRAKIVDYAEQSLVS